MTSRAERGIPTIEDWLALGRTAPTAADSAAAERIAQKLYGYYGDIEEVCEELDIAMTPAIGFALDDKAEQCTDCNTWGQPSDHVHGLCFGCRPAAYDEEEAQADG